MAIRAAVEADAAGIAEVHVATWQAAYRGHIPADCLAAMDVSAGEAKWRQALASPAVEPHTLLVAESDRQLIGFASAAASRDQDSPPGAGELWALYVRPQDWGRGIGGGLLRATEDWLRGAGFDSATLWTLSTNQRTRSFYEARGWVADGARKERERGGVMIGEVRYRRALP